MKKRITIGKKAYDCEVTGLTPVEYREAFNKDIFIELGDQLDLVEQGKVDQVDQTLFSRLAYVMTGAAARGEDYRNWLKGFGVYDFQHASGEILDLWQLTTEGLNVGDEDEGASPNPEAVDA